MTRANITQQKNLVVEQTRRIMGTDVSVYVAVPPSEQASAQAAVEACMAWFRDVDRRLTRFNTTSELCQLNDASGEWRTVSRLTFTAVQEALAAAETSAGLFDPTLLSQLEALGYDRDFALIGSDANGTPETQAAASSGSWQQIQMDARQQRIFLPRGDTARSGGHCQGLGCGYGPETLFSFVRKCYY